LLMRHRSPTSRGSHRKPTHPPPPARTQRGGEKRERHSTRREEEKGEGYCKQRRRETEKENKRSLWRSEREGVEKRRTLFKL
jgi:hypothetical protein